MELALLMPKVFDDAFYLVVSDCDVDGEIRLHAIGRVQSQTLVVVAFIDESADEAELHFHIIMARKAEALEEFFYAQQFS